jgi:uncharacterized protein YyaL (SSP411 family)
MNRLAQETSPYLQQHAGNPVDWYPWGEEALSRARDEDKPILLSIGYSACHWCHVMERESFEDPAIAAFMNEAFVNIKVDREERPDLDGIYMQAVQALTGRGGWPLTAFLTPEMKAFYGGTYFPPTPRHGMPSFRQLLESVLDAFQKRRMEVEKGADQLLTAIHREMKGIPSGPPSQENQTLDSAFQTLRGSFDSVRGGFGSAPKFPQPTTLEFLLRYHHRTGDEEALGMVVTTLRAMARGGMRDQLGGGFHRYSVDDEWLVPHFEKMLYDNGLLARIYLHAFLITGDEELRDVVTSTLDYLLEDLTAPEGGFFSARDADSEGEEGLFYIWAPEELDTVLGTTESSFFQDVYGVTPSGNFEGRSILHLPEGLSAKADSAGISLAELEGRLDRARKTLRETRSHREAPFRDEKVLVGWNSFVLRALAEAGAALGRADYLEAGRRNAHFLLKTLRKGDRLLRSWKETPGKIPGFLEDYAGMGNALLTLHEATLEAEWLEEAMWFLEKTVELFWDPAEEVFYDTPKDGEVLIVRPRDIPDKATPSGHSLAVEFLQRGAAFFGNDRFRTMAQVALAREEEAMGRFPSAFGRLLSILGAQQSTPLEVVLLGQPDDPGLQALLRETHRSFEPNRLVLGGSPEALPSLPLLEGRTIRDGSATAYVCRDFSCSSPIQTPESLRVELARSLARSLARG